MDIAALIAELRAAARKYWGIKSLATLLSRAADALERPHG